MSADLFNSPGPHSTHIYQPLAGARVVYENSGKIAVAAETGSDIDLAAITQAGGWKSTRMPLQYAEKIQASRSGMAKTAEKMGRDSVISESELKATSEDA